MTDISMISGKLRLRYLDGTVSLIDRPSGTRVSAMPLGEAKMLVQNLIRLINEAEGYDSTPPDPEDIGRAIEELYPLPSRNPFEPEPKPAPKVEIRRVSGSLFDGVWQALIDGRVWGTYPSASAAQEDLEKALRRPV